MEVVITPDDDFAAGTPCDVEEHNLNPDEVEETYDYDKSEMSLEDALTSLWNGTRNLGW